MECFFNCVTSPFRFVRLDNLGRWESFWFITRRSPDSEFDAEAAFTLPARNVVDVDRARRACATWSVVALLVSLGVGVHPLVPYFLSRAALACAGGAADWVRSALATAAWVTHTTAVPIVVSAWLCFFLNILGPTRWALSTYHLSLFVGFLLAIVDFFWYRVTLFYEHVIWSTIIVVVLYLVSPEDPACPWWRIPVHALVYGFSCTATVYKLEVLNRCPTVFVVEDKDDVRPPT